CIDLEAFDSSLINLHDAAGDLKNLLQKQNVQPQDPLAESVVQQISQFVKFHSHTSRKAKKRHQHLRCLQWIKLGVVGICIPISLGLGGLYLLRADLLPFVTTIFDMYRAETNARHECEIANSTARLTGPVLAPSLPGAPAQFN